MSAGSDWSSRCWNLRERLSNRLLPAKSIAFLRTNHWKGDYRLTTRLQRIKSCRFKITSLKQLFYSLILDVTTCNLGPSGPFLSQETLPLSHPHSFHNLFPHGFYAELHSDDNILSTTSSGSLRKPLRKKLSRKGCCSAESLAMDSDVSW